MKTHIQVNTVQKQDHILARHIDDVFMKIIKKIIVVQVQTKL